MGGHRGSRSQPQPPSPTPCRWKKARGAKGWPGDACDSHWYTHGPGNACTSLAGHVASASGRDLSVLCSPGVTRGSSQRPLHREVRTARRCAGSLSERVPPGLPGPSGRVGPSEDMDRPWPLGETLNREGRQRLPEAGDRPRPRPPCPQLSWGLFPARAGGEDGQARRPD